MLDFNDHRELLQKANELVAMIRKPKPLTIVDRQTLTKMKALIDSALREQVPLLIFLKASLHPPKDPL